MKIKSYATGGVYTPFYMAPAAQTSSKKKSGEDSDLSSPASYKSLLDMAGDKMLESDYADFVNDWSNLMQVISTVGEGAVPYDLIAQVKEKRNSGINFRERWEKASEIVNQRSAGDSNMMLGNQIWVLDGETNKIDTMDPYKLYELKQEDPGRYRAISNNEGLLYRSEKQYGLNWDPYLIQSATEAISLNTILDDFIKKTRELASQHASGQTLSEGVTKEMVLGAQLLVTPGSSISSTINIDPKYVDSYIDTLIGTTDAKWRNYLRGEIAERGGNPNDVATVRNFVKSKLQYYFGSSYDVVPEKETSSSSKSSGSGGDDGINGATPMTRSQMYASGIGMTSTTLRLSNLKADPNGSSSFVVSAFQWEDLQDYKDNTIDNLSTLTYIFDHAAEKSSWNKSAMFIGNERIDTEDFDQILYNVKDNTTYVVTLPVKYDEDGVILGINWDLLDKIDELKKVINKNSTKLEINQALQDKGIDNMVSYDKDTNRFIIKSEFLKQFATFGVTSSDAVLNKETTERFRQKSSISKDKFSTLVKNKKTGTTMDKKFLGTHIYDANIFILYEPAANAWITQMGEYVPKNALTDMNRNYIEGRVRQRQALNKDEVYTL